jgi:glutamyl-tRNA reductase
VKLLALGVDHRSAPTAVREALAFEGRKRDDGLDALKSSFPSTEFVLLSTCNRVEVYSATDQLESCIEVSDLTTFLAGFHSVPTATLASHLVAHHDEAVVGHVFRVASSLESLVLGEGQILGQVRDAYKAADVRKAVGPILHTVFRNALRVGKKVREETGMDRGKLSVASVALDVAKEIFDTFRDKTVLVIGAGKMADLTLQHLTTLRPGRILITNRSSDRAEVAASRWGGQAVPFDRLGQALIDADVVVSTTAAEEPIVTYEMYDRVQRARRNRLALILDIAVPRDFDPRVGNLEQVMLYNVDDLKAQVEQNLQGRRKGIDPAQAIIERETATCLADLHHQRNAGALLRQLGDYADAARQRELERLFASHREFDEAQREAIAHALLRVQNQLLHHPRSALRSAATHSSPSEHPHPLLNAVRHLFGLGPLEG